MRSNGLSAARLRAYSMRTRRSRAMPTGRPRILLCAAEAAGAGDVRALLEQAGHCVTTHGVNGTEPEELAGSQLIVLDGGQHEDETLAFCRRLRARLIDSYIPILYLTADSNHATNLASLAEGADTYLLRPFAP